MEKPTSQSNKRRKYRNGNQNYEKEGKKESGTRGEIGNIGGEEQPITSPRESEEDQSEKTRRKGKWEEKVIRKSGGELEIELIGY